MNARQAGIDDRRGDEQEDALEDQSEEVEEDQVEDNVGQRAQDDRCGNGALLNEVDGEAQEIAKAALLRLQAEGYYR